MDTLAEIGPAAKSAILCSAASLGKVMLVSGVARRQELVSHADSATAQEVLHLPIEMDCDDELVQSVKRVVSSRDRDSNVNALLHSSLTSPLVRPRQMCGTRVVALHLQRTSVWGEVGEVLVAAVLLTPDHRVVPPPDPATRKEGNRLQCPLEDGGGRSPSLCNRSAASNPRPCRRQDLCIRFKLGRFRFCHRRTHYQGRLQTKPQSHTATDEKPSVPASKRRKSSHLERYRRSTTQKRVR